MKLFLSLLPFIGSVLAMSIPRQEAEIASCICESVFCAQSWPDSCYCANEAKRACFEQCGGDVPVYDTCPPRDVTARAPEAVPEPQPQPDVAAPPPTCECEETFCLQSWPESCHCQNNAKKACFDKCGGEVPTYQTCPPLPTPEVPKAEPAPDCKCTEINCTLMWPTGCYCRYYAKQLCYEECGGERPTLDICYDNSTSGLTTRTMEAAPAPLAARAEAKHTNQKCGGNNGYGSPLLPCPSGQICIQDPFKPESCGPAGGEAGICVEAKMCGGLMGLECKTKGQICVDNPMDDCDPKKGGADCAGVCVWPQ